MVVCLVGCLLLLVDVLCYIICYWLLGGCLSFVICRLWYVACRMLLVVCWCLLVLWLFVVCLLLRPCLSVSLSMDASVSASICSAMRVQSLSLFIPPSSQCSKCRGRPSGLVSLNVLSLIDSVFLLTLSSFSLFISFFFSLSECLSLSDSSLSR